MLFPAFYICAKAWTRVPIVSAEEMDFVSGLDQIEADTYDEPPPRNKWEAFWQWLVRFIVAVLSPPRLLTTFRRYDYSERTCER